MKLIDADALIDAMTKFSDAMGEDMTHGIFYTHIAPTIDAVPVIRCKDCKHWDCDDSESYCDELGIFNTDMNSYCSYAKRREE